MGNIVLPCQLERIGDVVVRLLERVAPVGDGFDADLLERDEVGRDVGERRRDKRQQASASIGDVER